MVHLTGEIHVFFKPSAPEKYKPKNMTMGKPYQVIAEKTIKFSKEGKEYEDIQFGIIADNYELVFVASYNCHCIVHDGSENAFSEYYKFLNKCALATPQKGKKDETPF